MRKLTLFFSLIFAFLSTIHSIAQIADAENLGTSINSPYAERLPIIAPDGQTLYFARKYHPQNIGEDNHDDIWVSKKQYDGTWGKALNVGTPLNNKEHNFVVAVSPSGNVLYLANDYQSNKKDGVSVTVRKGRTWSNPRTLQIEDHYNESEFVSYYVGVDGRTLLMSVQREDSFGERDLYVSFQKGTKWTKPKNLGSTINTPGEEASVFLAADGKTMYFSSNGRRGLGGLDIYMTKRLDHTWRRWSTPKNLGEAFNTPEHELNFNIPASGDYAYFSSGSIQSSDLYRKALPKEFQPEPVTLVTGKIVDSESNRKLNGKLKVQNLEGRNKAIETNADGEFKVVVPYGENVGIYAEQDGYIAVSESLKLSDERLEELDYMPAGSAANEKEIEGLERKVKTLNAEVQQLEKRRQQPRKATRQTITAGTATSFRDPEMAALKAKYNAMVLQKEPAKTVTNSPKTTTKTASNYVVDDMDDLSELERMKAKYNKANNINQPPKNEKIDSRAILRNKKRDDELTEMKARFNKANNINQPEKVAEPKATKEEDLGFAELEEEVRAELEKELVEEVKLDLQKEVLEDAKQEVLAELDDKERNKLADPSLEKEVKAQYVEQVKAELREELREEVKAELREEWREKIKDELRRTLRKEIETELRRELREEVKKELREELKYQIKKEVEAELRKELALKKQEQSESQPVTQQPIEEEIEEPFAPEYQEVEQDIVLVPIKVGQVIPMNNIFFDSNEATLKEESFTELERVLDFLKQNGNLIVEVGGHTNGWCSHSFANELSDNRAEKVKDFFIENGISTYRIQHKGYGKIAPIASNDHAAGRRKNQRVELKILEIME